MIYAYEWEKLAAKIREDIAAGVYQPGQRLPGIVQLAESENSTKYAARRAFEELCAEGVVVTEGMLGHFVAGGDIRKPATGQQQVAASLRERIASGEFPPGAQLPSMNALGVHYGVSRNTVRWAMQRLAQQRVVIIVPYQGVYVPR